LGVITVRILASLGVTLRDLLLNHFSVALVSDRLLRKKGKPLLVPVKSRVSGGTEEHRQYQQLDAFPLLHDLGVRQGASSQILFSAASFAYLNVNLENQMTSPRDNRCRRKRELHRK
jgi:hypothetical protein